MSKRTTFGDSKKSITTFKGGDSEGQHILFSIHWLSKQLIWTKEMFAQKVELINIVILELRNALKSKL